jgi:hypothetical protein
MFVISKIINMYDQVQVILSPTVSRPVCLGVGAQTRFFITFGHLRSSCWGAPSLRRRWVCNLLVQFAVTLWSKSRRTHDHILLSYMKPYFTVSYETPPTWRARFLYLYPPGTRGPVISPDTGFPFCHLWRVAGLRWRWYSYVKGCYFNI